MTRARAAAVLAAFALSLVVVVATPWCTRDRTSPGDYAAAVRDNLDLIRPGDIVLVHPPWRDDVVDAMRTVVTPTRASVTTAFAPKHGEAWPSLVVIAEHAQPLPAPLAARVDGSTVRRAGDIDVFRVRPGGAP